MTKQKSIARELLEFSLPLILSGILQQLYNWADAYIVGHAEGISWTVLLIFMVGRMMYKRKEIC